MNNIFFILLTIGSFNAMADESSTKFQQLEARVNELESNLVDLQVDSIARKIKITGSLINRYENYFASTGLPGAPQASEHVAAFATYFGLNFNTYVTPKIGLYSTLAMSKFWNNEGRQEAKSSYIDSETSSYGLKGSTPKIDRAYMTYFFDFPLTFTIGRMSTDSGVPQNQLDGLERQGTYPRFAMNAIFDGMALTYNFNSLLPSGNELTTRFFYTPFTNVSDSDRTKQLNDNGVKAPSNTFQGGLLTEYSSSNYSWLSKLDIYHMVYIFNSFYDDSQNGRITTTTPNPKNPFYKGGANLGYLGLEDVGHAGLNFSVTGLFYWQGITSMTDPTAKMDSKVYHSKAFLININQRVFDNFIVGGEYITTDDNFYLDEWTNLNLTPFYLTPNSKGYHLFVTEKITKPITLRVGFYHLKSLACDATTTNSLLYPNDSNSNSVYANLRLDF